MNTIKVSDIIVPDKFTKTKPSEWKIKSVKEYVNKHKKLDKPVVLNGNTLKDNYIRYLVAVEMGIDEIPFITTQECKESFVAYVIGKFKNSNKEYTWKNRKNIPIDVGDKILVKSKTKTGKNVAVVTVVKTFKSNDKRYLKHKPVIRKIKDVKDS